MLQAIREYHDDPDNFDVITIPGNLFDVEVCAMIERYYAKFLHTQIRNFPYMLKTQWREMWGRSRKSGHYGLQELIDAKVLGVGHFKGCHFVYPLTRAMKWYGGNADAKPMESRVSDNLLLDYFMRAEFFLREEYPLYSSSEYAFSNLESLIQHIPPDAIEVYLPQVSYFDVEEEFLVAFPQCAQHYTTRAPRTVLNMVKSALDSFTKRNCYIKDVAVDRPQGFRLEMCVIHYPDSSRSRYHRLIRDLTALCACFHDSSFGLTVLADSDKTQRKASDLLSEVVKQREKKKSPNRCEKVTVVNTNIARYYQRGDNNLKVHESVVKDIEWIVNMIQATGTDPKGSEPHAS